MTIFDLNTAWNADKYLSKLDLAFNLNGRNSLLFNKDIANDSLAIGTAKKHVFSQSDRWHLPSTNLRKLAIYISAQHHFSISEICHATKAYHYDTDNIIFYGVQIHENKSFNCFGGTFKYISSSTVTYSNIHSDISHLLSSVCPHTLTPTVSPTFNPTFSPTLSPTNNWQQIMINETCIDASKGQQFRFKLPFTGTVSGVILEYVSGGRLKSKETKSSYWGSAEYNQFSVFIQDINQQPLYPDFAKTRNVIECSTDRYEKVFDFYYCFDDLNITVNDSQFILYSPLYSVARNDEWSVFYADDLLQRFKQHNILKSNSGIICFAVNVLYEYIETKTPTNDPSTSPTFEPTNIPSLSPTLEPTNNPLPPSTFEPTFDPIQMTTYNLTKNPTLNPAVYPIRTNATVSPTFFPSRASSSFPTENPSFTPTEGLVQVTQIITTLNPSKSPTIHPVDALINTDSESKENQIILHFSNTNNNNNKGANKCSEENGVECQNDATLQTCLLVISCTVITTVFIMLIISWYYQKNYIKKDNEAYNINDSMSRSAQISSNISLCSYIGHFWEKSDFDDAKNEKDKKKKNVQKIKAAKENSKKRKKKARKRKAKKKKNEMKAKILAAVGDCDEIELQANVSSDDLSLI